jgi:hypothetical protein
MFSIDLRSLALMRIFVGLVIIGDLIERSIDLSAHYTDEGIAPREMVFRHLGHSCWFSIHLISGSWWFTCLLFLLHGLAAFSMVIGYKTKFSTFSVWLLTTSLQSRNLLVLHGGDILMRLILFFAMFLPLGKRFSIDQFLKEFDQGPMKYNKVHKITKKSVICNVATFAIIAQFAMMYGFSTLHKTGDPWRKDYTATFYALKLSYFRLTIGDLLLNFPTVLKCLTFVVFYFERFGWLLLMSPVFSQLSRLIGVFGFIGMHFGFTISMAVGMFGWISMASLCCLLPEIFWEKIIWRFVSTEKRRSLTIMFDEQDRLSWMIVCFFRTFLVIPTTKFQAYQMKTQTMEHIESIDKPSNDQIDIESLDKSTKSTWIVIDSSKFSYEGFSAIVVVVQHSVLFFWMAPMLSRLEIIGNLMLKSLFDAFEFSTDKKTDRLYYETENESDKSTNQSIWYQFDWKWFFHVKNLIKLVKTLIVLFAVAWVFAFCCAHLVDFEFVPQPYEPGLIMRLDQYWSMFSPHPPKDDFSFSIRANLLNGSQVELFKQGGFYDWKGRSIDLQPSTTIQKDIRNHRWLKFWENVTMSPKKRFIRMYLSMYVCRNWNSRHRFDQQMNSFVLERITTENFLDHSKGPIFVDLLIERYCQNPIPRSTLLGHS